MDYFHPKFLLGLTATPERMDGRNIYEFCDYNVPYELTLREAINKGMLASFRDFGIYDSTDYSQKHLEREHYTEKGLNEAYLGNAARTSLSLRATSNTAQSEHWAFAVHVHMPTS